MTAPRPQQEEVKYYGQRVCLAVSKRRRDAIIRAYVTAATVKHYGALLRWCASQRRAYHVVTDTELEQICGSTHHEGVCLLVRAVPTYNATQLLRWHKDAPQQRRFYLFLAGTANPHNVGAIFRSAAHFGVDAILGDAATTPRIAGSLARISEGGCEEVPLVLLPKPESTLQALQAAGFSLVVADARAPQAAFAYPWPKRCVLILGHEVQGVSPTLKKLADNSVCIPGTGAVESLNVSVACGVLLAAWAQSQQGPAQEGRP